MGQQSKQSEPFAFILGLGLLLIVTFAIGYYVGWYGWLYY